MRAGEGLGTLLLALNIFLLLAGYSVMRPARDGLILTEGGAVVASYSAAAQAVLLMAVVPLYGWLGTRVDRIRLIAITMTFFAVTLVGFYLGGRAGLREGVAFYIWIGLINVFIVSQFWAFANDLYTEGQGRRLFPFIGVGQSLGAWVGAAAVTPLVRGLNYTPYTLMLLGAGALMVALAITLIVNKRETPRADPEGVAANVATLGGEGGFELVFKDRYLFWIAVLIVLLNVVNTTGNYLLNTLARAGGGRHGSARIRRRSSRPVSSSPRSRARLARRSTCSAFCCSSSSRRASFDSWASAARSSSFPSLALINYSIIAVAPILAVVRIGKILENSTDYSIQNTLRQALFLPTSREAKYKAKAAIDTFFTRGGDVVSAGFVALGQAIGLPTAGFAGLNVALTGVWLWVAGQIAKEHRKKTV